MSIAREARIRRFHQQGPWAVAIVAVLIAIGYEVVHKHIVTRFDALFYVVLVPTIILHEISHGVVAYWCGDDTAKDAGRLSLNPIRHIDIVGTILLPVLMILSFGRAFGWAKPVPVNIGKLRHPRNQAVLVGLAGPATNIILALIAGFVFGFVTHDGTGLPIGIDQWAIGDELLFVFGLTNVFIAAFNLIPIPPLDGAAVIERLIPARLLPGYYRLRMFSIILVLFFVFVDSNALTSLFNTAQTAWLNIVL